VVRSDLLQAADTAAELESARLFELLNVAEQEARSLAVAESENVHKSIQAAKQARLAALEAREATAAMEEAVRAHISAELAAVEQATAAAELE
jgi:hypothetical protein